METPSSEQLEAVWRGILANPKGKKVLAKLKRDGFAIDHLWPHSPKYRTWADDVAIIPFLPDQRYRRQIHYGKTLRKHLSLVKAMHQFAAKANDPFCEIRVVMKSETLVAASRDFGKELEKAADLVEKFISANWYTRERNPRKTIIAGLRWAIRDRTGNPHDSELSTLIDVALTAAGKDCMFLGAPELERIEKREKEGRVRATCRLNYVSGKSPSPLPAGWSSPKFSRNRAKRG